MFGIHNNKIKEILNLALLKEATYNEEAKNGLHDGSLSDFVEYLEKIENFESTKIDKKLINALNELDEQILLCVQAVMYLGRDYDVSEGISPAEVYNLLYRHLGGHRDDKDILIHTMTEKIPFGSYLQNGLRLLNVNL